LFATLLGSLPRPSSVAAVASSEALLDAVLAAQAEAGLGLLTDGGWPLDPIDAVGAWRATAARADRPVKAVLTGPLTAGLAIGGDVRELRSTIERLAEAGCPWVEIDEPAAIAIGTDEAARARFLDLHGRLLDGLEGVHVSLAITGGSADDAGAETILEPPYASLALDLIAGPDNWRLVTAAPPERGIVCGALSPRPDSDDGPEILLWAVGHASAGRGSARVGLASASSLAALPWEVAVAKLARLGEAARLADLPLEERRSKVDPRAVDSRSAALGRYSPRARPER
jgi:hypothetical protein